MLSRRHAMGTLAAACFFGQTALRSRSVPALPQIEPDRLSKVHDLLESVTALGMFNGTVKIDLAGETLFDRSYGFADYERRLDFTDKTIFRIASLSKNMTNAALGAMVERGEIRLDQTIDRFLPDFPSADIITIEQIVQHRSGIPHTNDQPWGDGSTRLTPDEVLSRLSRLPLAFAPGSERSYSNGGYSVLARIMEMVRGQPYREIMSDLVFRPLGMEQSGEIIDSRASPVGWAKGYAPGETIATRQPARFYAAETRQGGGSLHASADDVLTFFRAAWRGTLPGKEGAPALFGRTGARLGADGRAPGFYMDVHYARDADLLVSSTANNYAAEFRWAENIARIVLDDQPLFTRLPSLDRAGRVGSEGYIGQFRYENPGLSQAVEIAPNRLGQLVFHDRAAADSRALLPLAEGGFLDPLYYLILRPEANGQNIRFAPLYEGGFSGALIRRG
jgi:CubicO group peptidase (beta-lactamase class C family)